MLKKDIMELCLLQLLASEDMYGYEILRRLHAVFPDTQESAIYAQLRAMCRQGYTESYTRQSPDGPNRKYYRLLPTGQIKREELLLEWRKYCSLLADLGLK